MTTAKPGLPGLALLGFEAEIMKTLKQVANPNNPLGLSDYFWWRFSEDIMVDLLKTSTSEFQKLLREYGEDEEDDD